MKVWTGVCVATLYVLARLEVSCAILTKRFGDEHDCGDLLPPRRVPSIALGAWHDHVLAEIDQDGFVFAVDQRDSQLFGTRGMMVPRRHHRVHIVLKHGAIRVRKSYIRKSSTGIAGIYDLIRLDFYLEAAALLRLFGLPGVPTLRVLDPRKGIIEMDYIWGPDLRQILAGGKSELQYDQISDAFFALVAQDCELSKQVAALVAAVIARGVIPRDVHPANFVQSLRSKRLYIIDFNFVYLRPAPGWQAHLHSLDWLLK